MGANASNMIYNTVNQTMTDISTNVMTNVTNNTSATANVSQTINVEVGPRGVLECGSKGINFTQDGKASLTALGSLSNKQVANLANEMESKFKSTLEAKLKQKNSQLNLGQANIANIAENVSNVVKNNIHTVVKNSIRNTITVDAATNQVQGLYIDGKVSGGDCNFDQKSTVTLVAQGITSQMSKIVQSNKAVTTAVNKSTATVSQTNTGINIFAGVIALLLILGIGGAVSFGAADVAKKYLVPILIVLSLIVGVYTGYKREWIALGIAAVVFVGASGFEAYELLEAPKVPDVPVDVKSIFMF